MNTLFYRFGKNILEIFSGRNILWHLLAILVTYIAVVSGFDWEYYLAFHDTVARDILFSGIILGGLLPIILPVALYFVGKMEKNKILLNTAYAVAQAALLGSLISSLYKAFTGRLQPSLFSIDLANISSSFQFGFWEHGIFWGWPSSHTTIAFAVGTTLFMLFPKSLLLRIVVLLSAFWVGIGTSMSIHWFSDFLAGAIIGSVIGYVVGRGFSNKRIS